MDEASDLILITDFTPPSQGGPFIEYANESLLRAIGCTMDELSGRSYQTIISPDNDPVVLQTITDNLEAAHVNEKEIKLRRKDGGSFWVEFAGKPLYDDLTGSSHWVSVGRDITLRKRSVEETLTLMTALDAVSGHLEIYSLDGGEYTAVFRNHDADADISELVETLLNDPILREATALRERLSGGESVTVTTDGLQIRPCSPHAETLLCIKQKAS
ncbi:MAG TPA: PAS domain-containing protein [Candidatus Baltobacteraceae bacterium]|nr:PAS domain-containing protein [Candidatus Baltobacteraceae bacterium]